MALTVHALQLEEHGGGQGVRDAGLLASAMARPENLAAYADPDACELVAANAFGMARNHPFADGNKRTALVACETFLLVNNHDLDAGDADLVAAFETLAAGQLTEADLAIWLRERTTEVE